VTAKGKLTDNIVAVGGVTWLDAELTDMTGANAKNNGNQVVGIPEWQANLLTEYSFDRVPGLTASVNVHYAGKRSADAENYSWADGYVTVDAGARYKSFIMGHEVTWRAAVENIFDERYWASINGDMSGTNGATNTAYLGAPRTFKASMSVKFRTGEEPASSGSPDFWRTNHAARTFRPPSFMRIMGARWLASKLHPARYSSDLRGETRRFYALFFGVTPTDGDLDLLFGQ
jgi:hypothetical protein